MKKWKKILIATVFILIGISSQHLLAQWEHSGGPEGGTIQNLYFSQGRIFANMEYFSDDRGDIWQVYNNAPFTDKPIVSFVESGSRMILTGNNKVYASDNKGNNWSEKMSGLPSDIQVPRAFIGPSSLYLVGFDGKFFTSNNHGDSWQNITTDLGNFRIYQLVFVNNMMVAYTENPFKADEAIFYSSNGINWNQSNFKDIKVSSLLANNGIVYASTQSNGLYISSDNGITFSQANTSLNKGQLVNNNGNVFYFSNTDGVNLLAANGQSVTPKNNGVATNFLYSLVGGDGVLYLGTEIGVYRSGDDGNNWTLANKGLGYQPINALENDGDVLYAATDGGVWQSNSYGLRWVPIGLNEYLIQNLVKANGVLYALAQANLKINVFKSADGGQNWVPAGTNLPSSQYGSLHVFKNNLLLSTSTSGIYSLTNFSGSWQKINNASGNLWDDGTYLYVGKDVLKRTSDLSTWQNLSGLNTGIGHFTKDQDYYYAAGIWRSSGMQQMYRSSDGINFTLYNTGLPKLDGVDIVTRDNVTYFAFQKHKPSGGSIQVYNDLYVFKINMGDTEWTEFQPEIPKVLTADLHLTNESLLVGSSISSEGLFRYNFLAIPPVPDDVDVIDYPPLDPAILLSSNPQVTDLAIGGNKQITLTVDATGNYTGTVNLAVEGSLPDGLTADFSTTTIATEGDATVTFTAGASLAPGQYTVKIKASSGSLSDDATIVLNVAGATSPDFALELAPSSLSINQGGNAEASVSYNGLAGFADEVTLSIKNSSLVTGITATFDNTTLSASGSSQLTVNAATNLAAGQYTLVVVGTSGSLTREINLPVTIVEVEDPDFALSVNPNRLTTNRGESGVATVVVQALNGFTGTVDLTLDNDNPEVTPTLSANTIDNEGNVEITLAVAAEAAVGETKITVTGTHDTLIHSDTLYLQITVPVIANNQFSPNGDLQDETWFIENIDLMPEYEVIVFNRVGQEVFRSKAYQNDWNGMSNGKTLLPTTYFYVIRNEKGKNVESGSVNLIR